MRTTPVSKRVAQLPPSTFSLTFDSIHCPRHKSGISTVTSRDEIDQQGENSERGDKRWTVTTLASR